MFSTSNLTTDFLESKRHLTDTLADQTVATIIDEGFEERINEIFLTLHRNDGFNPSLLNHFPQKIQESVASYFTESAKLPEWADQALIKKGQEVFSEFGPEIFMLLNVKSLPMCYTCAHGAQVLYDTGRLVEHKGKIDPLVRRLMETAQMVVNVLQPGGLDPNGEGIVTVQKVRLIHASIRHFLKSTKYNPEGWDASALGEPINQEDLAGTLMSFSPVILSGLKQLDINLSDEQILAYSHCWKVIGYLIGLQEDLLSDSFDDNWELACAILKHQAEESDSGKTLTSSCVAFIQHMIPGNLFDEVPEYMIWYFFQDIEKTVGKPLASMIGISDHENPKDRLVLKISQMFTSKIAKAEHQTIIKKLTGEFNKLMLQGYIKHYNEGKQVRFLIPPSLTADWGLNEVEPPVSTTKDTGKKLTWLIVITQFILVSWSIGSSILEAGPVSASIVTYSLFGFYVAYTLYTKDPTMIKLVTLGTIAGIMELYTDHYLVDTINNLVYPGKEAMIWSSPAYMPFAWANVLIQLGYYGILLSRWKGWPIASIILGLAGGMYIPLYEHLAKDAGWWWYHQNVPMIFNAPIYVIICEGLISLSLPLLLTRSSNKGLNHAALYGVICGVWIYLSAVLSYWIGG